MKKLISTLLIFCMLLTAIPFTCYAEETNNTEETYTFEYTKLTLDHKTDTLYVGVTAGSKSISGRYFYHDHDDYHVYDEETKEWIHDYDKYKKMDEMMSQAKKVVIDEGITCISRDFFHDLPNLKEVVLPSSLKEIGKFAFWNCPKLMSVYGKNVNKIGAGAFAKCTSLEYVEFPVLESLYYEKLENIYDDQTVDECYWAYPTRDEYVGIFQECSSLMDVNIPNLRKIGAKTFYKCTNLISVNDNRLDNVSTVGRSAFYGCKDLETISLSSITSLSSGYDFLADTKCEGVFGNCTSLKSVNIPNISYIGNGCFYGCTNLKKINSNNNLGYLYELGAYAFAGCKSLETITIKTGKLKSGKWYTFKKDAKWKEYSNAPAGQGLELMSFDHWLLVDRYKTAKTNYCGVFENCTNLKTVNLYNTTDIGSRAFLNCKNLQNVSISKATNIGTNSFLNCKKLKKINLANTKKIESQAFANCSNLQSVNIPKVKDIGVKSFISCTKLSTVKTGNNGKSIGNYAFYKCSSLKTFTIPKQVTQIGVRSFAKCSKLKTINFRTTAFNTIGLDAFKLINKTPTFNLPKSKVKTYKRLIKPNAPSKAKFVGKF